MGALSRPANTGRGRADRPRRLLAVIAMAIAVVMAGCTAAPGPPQPTLETPQPSAGPSTQIPPADDLFIPGRAEQVVAELVKAAQGRPIVRVAIDRTRARLTYVDQDDRPASVVWLAGVISPSDDGTDMVGATSFDPTRFNLSDIAELFATAARISGSTQRQELQINEYNDDAIYMTITTSPETTTVFFDHSGRLVPRLNLLRDADLRIALDDVLANRLLVVAVGVNRGELLWADVVASPGVVERRMRPTTLPVYRAQRREAPSTQQFDVTDLDAGVLATLIRTAPAMLDQPPGSAVTLLVSWPESEPAPVITVEVGGATMTTDLAGVPISDS